MHLNELFEADDDLYSFHLVGGMEYNFQSQLGLFRKKNRFFNEKKGKVLCVADVWHRLDLR